ncbi:hypothetical protein PIB30_001482 [Stylosanthes scabra]|uniref:Disease resistance protein At4g27190-like leucine-rich repeats domain-containing protein n=1 Tax=Stylosanthes scabra TaxID=79078 RepID=A0ABU6Q2J1_9FABA|nr:hypothetical protein [Stylosanthes scabra]
MKSLAILDLSYNHNLKRLPNSLSDLTSLVSLVLKGCEDLKNIPPLGGLKNLSRLVISMTSVEQVLGLEMLTNLRWLDLSWNYELSLESGSVLRGLTNLQYLNLFNAGQLNVELEDVQGLTTLERFVAYFLGHESYNNYVKSIWNRGSGPRDYFLYFGEIYDSEWICDAYDAIEPIVGHYQILYFFDCVESPHLLPKDLSNIYIESNTDWKSLCGALSCNAPSSLITIDIGRCTEMKSLFCLFGNCSFCTNLKNLQCLELWYLESLRVICKEDVAETDTDTDTDTTTQLLSPKVVVFSHLRRLRISHCYEIETLVTAGLLSQLQNLQTLTIEFCISLREIFAASSSDAEGASTITLCNFTTLELIDLPMLESVCKGIIICPSLQKLNIKNCPKLESRSPFQVSLSS